MRKATLGPHLVGAVLARPLWDPDGRDLVATGGPLTRAGIDRLRAAGYAGAYVSDPFAPDLPPDPDLDDGLRRTAERGVAAALTALAAGRPPDWPALMKLAADLLAVAEARPLRRFDLNRVRPAATALWAHSVHVAALAGLVANALALDRPTRLACVLAGLVHDAGKAMLPRAILAKPGPLNRAEWGVVRDHPRLGARAVSAFPPPCPEVVDAVLAHHERLDGSGYPQGLRAAAIRPVTRIVSVADVWDALVSDRVYSAPWTPSAAAAHLRAEAGHRFDRRAALALLRRVVQFPVGEYVRLADGRLGLVAAQGASPTRPCVLVLSDAAGRPVPPRRVHTGPRRCPPVEVLDRLPPAVAAVLADRRDEVAAVLATGRPAGR
jgi:HD-GYP domain-containing protein (c-di-GMP phosphodiesterase class II)